MPSQHTYDNVYVEDSYVESKEHCNGERLGYGTTYARPFARTEIERNWTNEPGYLAMRKAKVRVPDHSYNYERKSRGMTTVTYVLDSGPSSTCPVPNWELYRLLRTWKRAPGYYVPPYEAEQKTTSDAAIARLFSRAKGAEFSMPIFFGEARETLNMVLGTARHLAGAYRSLRRGDLIGAHAHLRMEVPSAKQRRFFERGFGKDARGAAANHWLAMQYGWMPLLADVKNAAEQLGEFVTNDEKFTGRVTSRHEYVRFEDTVATIEVSPLGTARRQSTVRESYRYTWLFKPTELNNLGSLGLLNPFSVAWELVPLSFVVDWMFPIGRYLEHLDVPLRFQHLGGTSGYARLVDSTYSDFKWNGAQGVGVAYKDQYLRVSRDKLNSIPSLGLSSIRWDPNLGVARTLSGLALASQAFKR